MRRLFLILIILVVYLTTSSHELFLKTDSYFLSPGELSELYLFNGTFDNSENSISVDRIIDFTILGPDYNMAMELESFYEKDSASYLKFKAGKEGTYLAGISTKARTLEMTAKAFNEYLEHEGLIDNLQERKEEGSYDTGANEKYSKHVKAVLQVGNSKTEDYKKVLGYPIEFVPMVNPYQLNVGQAISFQLLRDGKPLPNHVVHYSASMPGSDAHENETSTKTDANGIVEMIPTHAGNWYVATIHLEKSAEEELDYESNWATLTFGVR